MAIRNNCIPSASDWKRLTIFGQKKAYFSTETYFRESWFDADNILGTDAIKTLHRLAVIVFKPDAIAARKCKIAMDLLIDRGFVPIATRRIQYNRHVTREIWRYQFSEATIDRLELVDDLYTIGDALMVILWDSSAELEVPASARLHQLKGASEKHKRSNDSLRTRLDAPNGVIRFIHVPDEPADIVREFGIIFSREERREVYEAIRTRVRTEEDEVVAQIEALESSSERCDFSIDETWVRVLAASKDADSVMRDIIQELFHSSQNGVEVGLEDIVGPLRKLGVHRNDVLTIATTLIKQDVEGEFHLIDGDALRGWDPKLVYRA